MFYGLWRFMAEHGSGVYSFSQGSIARCNSSHSWMSLDLVNNLNVLNIPEELKLIDSLKKK